MLDVMQRYSLSVYEGRLFEKAQLADPIEQVIRCVQRELHARENLGALDSAAAVELYFAQKWAIYALIEWKGNKAAKETLLRLADGRPLAICVGGGKRRTVETILGTSHVTAIGCFRVFEDVTRTSGRMWPQKCPDCRPRNRKKNPLRDAETALRRRAQFIDDLRRRGYVSS